MHRSSFHLRQRRGFSLVEAIVTIAILGIIAALVVSSLSNASRDAGRMVGRQQQAAINAALQQWISANTRDPSTGRMRSISTVRATYNSFGTSLAKLQALEPYIGQQTMDHFLEYTTNSGQISSEALKNAGQHISLPNWATTEDAPTVSLQ
jgi:prepilin-type N-terminal cleavage/methylation domain-containing protein